MCQVHELGQLDHLVEETCWLFRELAVAPAEDARVRDLPDRVNVRPGETIEIAMAFFAGYS